MFYKSKSGNENLNIQDISQQGSREYKLNEVFGRIKEVSKERKFDETVDVMVKLNVDPTKGD
jgi:ribosomal protein L1